MNGDGGNLPLAIFLLGIGCVAGFMALRPWPQTSGGKPIKPGAYVIDVIKAQPPPAGPSPYSASDVQLTELGLGTLLAIWAASKLSGLIPGLGGVGGAAGGGEGESGGEGDTIGEDIGAAAEDL